MDNEEVIVIEEQPWFDPHKDSPLLDENVSGLDFALRPAQSEKGQTIALLGSYNLTAPYVAVYAGIVAEAIAIVAIDTTEGRVYYSDAQITDAVPASAYLDAPSLSNASNEDSILLAVSGHFNVDLRESLHLPDSESHYAVFLWLDELTSSVKTVKVPSQSPSENLYNRRDTEFPDEIISFGRKKNTPTLEGSNSVIQFVRDEPEQRTSPIRVYATFDVSLLKQQPAKNQDGPFWLTIMALSHVKRTVFSKTIRLPDHIRGGQEICLDYRLLDLVSPHEWPQKVYLLFCLSGALSSVYVVDPDQYP